MSFLYTITIYPLELIYHFIYAFFIEQLSGNYGLALLLLSVFTTVLFIPLKKIVIKIENKERLIQSIIKPQIERIKIESVNAERYLRISKLYKRYSYHPIYGVRSLSGIALQLPFLIAAYSMLSSFSDIQGQSFGFIKDLSEPDGLFYNANLLPLLMTLFNVLAIFLNKSFLVKERIQTLFISLFFFIILYSAPSALLIYWTANNAFLCIKEIFPRIKEIDFKNINKIVTLLFKKQISFIYLIKITIRILISTFFLSVFVYYFWLSLQFDSTGDNLYIAFDIIYFFIFASPFFVLNRLIKHKIHKANFILLLLFYPCLFIGLFFESYNLNISSHILFFLLYMVILKNMFANLAYDLFSYSESKSIYIISITVITLLLFVFCPIALYSSDSGTFSLPLFSILVNMIPLIFVFAAVATLIWIIIPNYYCSFLSFFTFFLATIFILNTFLFNGDYGSLEGITISNTEFFRSLWCVILDILAVCIIYFLLYLIIKFDFKKYIVKSFSILSFSIIIFSIINIYSINNSNEINENSHIHDIASPLGFSKDGTNVLVFFIDMFTGSHLEDMLQEDPNLQERLSGFVWYPDTISIGDSTLLSTASIYGGAKYTPDILNANTAQKNLEKIHAASVSVANDYGRKGYNVDFLGFGIPAEANDINRHFDKIINAKYTPKLRGNNISRWLEEKGIENKKIDISHYMLMTSLFRTVPHRTKRNIYIKWKWFGAGEELFSNMNFYKILENLAFLDLLPQLSNNEIDKNTFKVIYTDLAHTPWNLPDNEIIPVRQPYPNGNGKTLVNGIIPEHYYSEKHVIRLLTNYFDWMREKGIYDNTYILLVSDHDAYDSKTLNLALGRDDRGIIRPYTSALNAYPGRPHALLMVKPLHNQSEFQASPTLMSTSDVAPLVCSVIGGCQDVEPFIEDEQRIRYHYVTTVSWAHDYYQKFFNYERYKITGTMFNKDNWTKE